MSLGAPAPDFRLPDLKGRFRTLADYRGKPAVMIFFNPDCGFCTQLAPKLGARAPDDDGKVRRDLRRIAAGPARREHVYDIAQRVGVLCGGRGGSGPNSSLADTWA